MDDDNSRSRRTCEKAGGFRTVKSEARLEHRINPALEGAYPC